MPGLGTRLDKFAEFAALAEDAGFDACWDYEFWRNPFTIHMTTAAATAAYPARHRLRRGADPQPL